MYNLEVYSSIIWGSVVRCQEAQSKVSYPSEVEDELFTDSGYHLPSSIHSTFPTHTITNSESWLHGWNFTTDLYRILEHIVDDSRRSRDLKTGRFTPSDIFGRDVIDQKTILGKAMLMHEQLPARFKDAKMGQEEKFSFQAANIALTLQLVRMLLFASKETSVVEKCIVARDLLEGFSDIPVIFLRALSAPLLHHLAGIGSILGSVTERSFSEASYIKVREVL